MPNNIIGTVNVQVGQPTGPKVPTITSVKTLKTMSDLNMDGVKNDYVITYKSSTNSFVMKQVGDAASEIDAGFF